MKIAFAAIAGLFAAEAAIACVCIPLEDPDVRREAARRIAAEASSVAVIEQAETAEADDARPPLYRVRKVHYGKAPRSFRLAQLSEEGPSGRIVLATSCDVVPPPGKPTVVVLYPSDSRGSYRIGGTCDHLFVNSPGAIGLIREEARKLARRTERG